MTEALADLIDSLAASGMQLGDLMLIGHGLGLRIFFSYFCYWFFSFIPK